MRRLAAIMFTDMVGFSALTQQNEALALELLEEHRQLLRPLFAKHEGHEIETAGDAFFVEFNSAVEAANCAIEIQTALHSRNELEPPQRHIRLRIGLHIGDVVYVGQQVHGDGVNIAARMEPLAQPGGICLSEDAARQIRNKIRFPVLKLGEEKLKNISMPMDIYSIQLPWLERGTRVATARTYRKLLPFALALLLVCLLAGLFLYLRKAGGKKAAVRQEQATATGQQGYDITRLAVLPLANYSNDPADAYFADGLTEELISSLSKVNELSVIARTSVMQYKDTDTDIAAIGKALMVGSVLEGSVRKFQNKVRVTVQLIDVASQAHRWSMDYDRELKDIISLQSEIALNVARELQVRLIDAEEARISQAATANTEAFRQYLLGKQYLNKKTPQSIQTAIGLFEQAIVHDPQYALPYASLAYAYTLIGVAGYGGMPRELAIQKAKQAVMKALELDANLAEAHAALGYIRFRIDWDWAGAEEEFRRAIDLQPSYATAHEWYGFFLGIHVRLDEALREMRKAWELDPLSPSVNTGLSRIYHFRKENDLALEQINHTLALAPNFADAHFSKGMIYFQMQQFAPAIESLQKAIALSNRRPVMLGTLGMAYAHLGQTGKARQLLAELEKPPHNNDKLHAISLIKHSLGQEEEALSIMEKLLAERYGLLIFLKVQKNTVLELKGPRYERMLRKMNLD